VQAVVGGVGRGAVAMSNVVLSNSVGSDGSVGHLIEHGIDAFALVPLVLMIERAMSIFWLAWMHQILFVSIACLWHQCSKVGQLEPSLWLLVVVWLLMVCGG